MIDAPALSNLLAWSLQALAVVLSGAALPWLLRLRAPGPRHAYWRVLLLACLLLPGLQAWQPRPAPVQAPVPSAYGDGVAGSSPHAAGGAFPVTAPPAPAGHWPGAMAFLLVAGAVGRLGWLAAGLLHLRRLRRAACAPAAGDEHGGDREGVGADVRYVAGVHQPVTFGLRRPVVLLPERLRAQAPGLRRAVLEHELWHVRRRDWFWVVVEETVRSVLWFHPAIVWLISRVQSSREEVVDELTILSTNARRDYLAALLAFADQPPLYPAAPFARRRHLFNRMLLVSQEVVMSSTRVVATCAAMGAIVLLGGWYGVSAFPLTVSAAPAPGLLQGQPRDLRPGEPAPPSAREVELRTAVVARPTPDGYLELARLREARGALTEAEGTLTEGISAVPGDRALTMALAGVYGRAGRFELAVQTVERAASLWPSDPAVQHVAATFYEEKVRKDPALSAEDARQYLEAGIAAEDRALALNPDFADALIIKNILLRHQANREADGAARARLLAEADHLRTRAFELRRTQNLLAGKVQAARAPGDMPPPPPPPPPPGPLPMVDGRAPLRVGGTVAPPAKIRDVRPVYPPDARAAGVAGVVILEVTIDGSGSVRDARVLRSVPGLDEAAVEAVEQWQFTPTLLNGQPVPVVMTVTVNFTLQ